MKLFVVSVNSILFLLENGVINVANKYKEINNTNYYPINDGDTGNNLKCSLFVALKKVKGIQHQSVPKLLAKFSEELLMGAVGNSGIIFARSFMGFCENLEFASLFKKHANLVVELLKGWKGAAKSAYSTFSQAQEGTMMTLIKAASEHLASFWNNKPLPTITDIFEQMYLQLKKTLPQLLKYFASSSNENLRTHLDAGALGFFYFFEGLYLYLCKNQTLYYCGSSKIHTNELDNLIGNIASNNHKISIDFDYGSLGYCHEQIILAHHNVLSTTVLVTAIKRKFEAIAATSVVVSEINQIIKIHCHHQNPAEVLAVCASSGVVLKSKIENMTLQNHIFQQARHHKEENKGYERNMSDSASNIICYSRCQSWATKISELKLFAFLQTSDAFQLSSQDTALLEQVSKSKHRKFIVIVHNDDTSAQNEIPIQINAFFQQAGKQYQLVKYKYNFECYMSSVNNLTIFPGMKNPQISELYYDKVWAEDNIIIYLIRENNGVNVIINGAKTKHLQAFNQLTVATLFQDRSNKYQYFLDDFDEVIISQESDANASDTEYLKQLFHGADIDLTITLQKGNEANIAYTILIC